MTDPVPVGDAPLTVEDVVRVARGAPIALAGPALERIRASRAVVDAALASGAAIYGLTTGVGHLKDTRLPDDALVGFQQFLLTSHASGVGPDAPTEVVRAAMLARLAGLARGGSGASPAVAEVLRDMLNAGVHPVIAMGGSVGAGDLGQMATIGLVAVGGGTAEVGGEVLPGGEALRRAGIAPLALAPKDGLALLSANGLSVGHGALVVDRARRLAEVADLAVAVSLEAVRGSAEPTLPAVARVKPFRGQATSAARQRAALEGGDLLEPGAARSVQDPLSFRVAPQVNGALREYAEAAAAAVTTELNASGDNPLVDPDTGLMIHNGNFHPIVPAIAFDALRVALAHAGAISERRLSHLWDAFFAHQEGGGPPPAGPLFGMSLRYAAAALVADLRQLAGPASLDVPPLDQQIEDHSTGAPTSVARTADALDALAGILAVELLLAADILAVTGTEGHRLGTGAAAAVGAVRDAVAAAPDRSPAQIHREVRDEVLPGIASRLV